MLKLNVLVLEYKANVKNSNTTLVKVKCQWADKNRILSADSNTTLVKVKYIPNGPALGKTPYSNTTLVKVKFENDLPNGQGKLFKYNSC